MPIDFCPITDFPRGTLAGILLSAYAFDERCARAWRQDWLDFDDFFYDHPSIADACGFITALEGEAVGFVSWDPRQLPERAVIGHNGVMAAWKGRGYGTAQMQEALRRVRAQGARRAVVTTNETLTPAPRMYERAGMRLVARREGIGAFPGAELDYEIAF